MTDVEFPGLGSFTREQQRAMERMIEAAAAEKAASMLDAQKPEHRMLLKERFERYLEVDEFAVGDLVVWKDGLKNRRIPEYREPVLVAEIIDPPLIGSEENSGSAYYREPSTVKLGLLDEDDELVFFHFDGARFRKFDESEP